MSSQQTLHQDGDSVPCVTCINTHGTNTNTNADITSTSIANESTDTSASSNSVPSDARTSITNTNTNHYFINIDGKYPDDLIIYEYGVDIIKGTIEENYETRFKNINSCTDNAFFTLLTELLVYNRYKAFEYLCTTYSDKIKAASEWHKYMLVSLSSYQDNIKVLQILLIDVGVKFTYIILDSFVCKGSFECAQWLINNTDLKYNDYHGNLALLHGDLAMLKIICERVNPTIDIIRVYNETYDGNFDNIVECLRWLVANNKVKVNTEDLNKIKSNILRRVFIEHVLS